MNIKPYIYNLSMIKMKYSCGNQNSPQFTLLIIPKSISDQIPNCL